MLSIKVKEITSMALTDDKGKILREKINEKIDKGEEKITIDFEGIQIFTTMFFNASIGHFVLKYGPEIMKRFELLNLSELGKDTLNHSFINAKSIYEKGQDQEIIAKVTNENIDDL